MITIRPAVKKDYYNFHSMNLKFIQEYDGLTNTSESPKNDFCKNLDLARIIELDGNVIGYYTLQGITYKPTYEKYYHIKDMYISSEYRGQGFAKKAREYAIKKDKIHGVMISYGRARKNIDYFVKQGFTSIIDDVHEQRAEDNNLCLILCNTKFYPNSMQLNLLTLNKTQEFAKKFWDTCEFA